MTDSEFLRLNDGRQMPQFGFGVWQIPPAETTQAVTAALDTGFRLIDTAAAYGNEAEVGQAVNGGGAKREGVFVTTKLANPAHGFDEALRAFDKSLGLLGAQEVDLYLIHWPRPVHNRYVETWRALVRLKEEGRARSIGVSNFTEEHLQRLVDETGVVPAVNQVELHPQFQQRPLREFHARHGIVTQSWSPLGRGRVTEDPVITAIAAKHGRSWAQVALRWHLQSGLSAITRSVSPARIRENHATLGFTLDDDDMARLATLDRPDGRIGAHPNDWGN